MKGCKLLSQSKSKAIRKAERETAKESLSENKSEVITTSSYYLLKWIACITMLIDHIALFFRHQCSIPDDTYLAMRYIGRIAFPLFAYLMVESFHHTKSRGKHLFHIGILALVSEIPFDVINISRKSLEGNVLTFEYQNVCISLFLSYLLLLITDKPYEKVRNFYRDKALGKNVEANIKILFLGLFVAAGTLLNVDFGMGGILLVFLLNASRKTKHKQFFQALSFAAFGLTQAHIAYLFIIVPFALICLVQSSKHFHQKEALLQRFMRSKFSKLFTKTFYPVHMIALIAVRIIMAA